MALNGDMLCRVRDAILADPDHFDMSKWISACGTSACVAGRACLVAGDVFVRDPLGLRVATVRISPTQVCTIAERARFLLGLTEDQAQVLFYSSNIVALRYLDQLIEEAST